MVEAGNADLLQDYMTARQAAEALRVSRRTLDAMHARRAGPPRTVIARRVYYSRSTLEQWVREQQETPPTPPRRRR